MSSTKKNNKWYFGAKGHIGTQAQGKPIIHSVEFTTAKTADIKVIDKLYHGDERAIFGDSAYTRRADKEKARKDGLYYGISDRGRRNHPLSSTQKKKNRKYSSIRAKVEHPFRVIKCIFDHRKLRYKGLAKNAEQFTALCALSNLFFTEKICLPQYGCIKNQQNIHFYITKTLNIIISTSVNLQNTPKILIFNFCRGFYRSYLAIGATSLIFLS